MPDVMVPPMVLLPLAENAMKHGPLAKVKGDVRISVEEKGDRVVVSISNPGSFEGRRDGGSGLPIVEKRLALAYGGAASLSIAGDDGRTTATVTLPKKVPEVTGDVTVTTR
jgi:LytS/YehU family sensor histidine kinase